MGKSSRQKRRTYQTPKRARTGANLVWYAAAFVVVVGGILAVMLSRSNSPNSVGPQSGDHWHAALGVENCGKWTPNWLTPTSPSTGSPVRAGTETYAGLHSHGDGLIHMEPTTSDEMGRHATVGEYFKFAGFQVSSTSISFAGTVNEKNGNKCDGKPGVLRWEVNGVEHHGNPASYKIFNGDVIAIVFTTADAKLPKKSEVPSYKTLQDILGQTNPTEPAPGQTTPNAAATTTTPSTSAPTTTSKSSAPTTAGATTTSKP
jgi:hypothetical protein